MATEKTSVLQYIKALPHMRLKSDMLRNGTVFIARQTAALLLGGLLVQAQFTQDSFTAAAPFAIALAAAGQIKYLGMNVLGMAISCLLFLPYPANVSVMALAAFAGIINLGIRKFGLRHDLAAPVNAFGCSAVSGIVALLTQSGSGMRWIYALCGAVLAGCCAYFILMTQSIPRVQNRWQISRRSCAALMLCCGMALMSLCSFHIGAFWPAHILAVIFVLAAAYCWRETGGAIAGACAGAAVTLAGGEPILAVVFALGGLLAGAFSTVYVDSSEHAHSKRKHIANAQSMLYTVPLAGGFSLACVFYLALHGAADYDPANAVLFALESLGAILLFLCVPVHAWNALRSKLATPGETVLQPPEQEAALQLSQTAGALHKVGEYVNEVLLGLEQLQSLPEQSVYAGAEELLCTSCPEYVYCHQDHSTGMADFHERITKLLRKNGDVSPERLMQIRRDCGIGAPCRCPEELREILMRSYDMYAVRKTCEQTEGNLRRAAAAQFDTLSGLMEEVSVQLTRQKTIEIEAAQAAQRVLNDHGYGAQSVVCVREAGADHAAQLTAAVRPEEDRSSMESLTNAICRATGIRFSQPETAPLPQGDGALLTFAQKPLYALETGAVQMSSSRSDFCGDYFDCFNDGRGRDIMVISDGMGTGGRAAVDSALATEIFSVLVRCGLSFCGAVGIVNQALLLKSCEETLATIDAAGINLYTGEVEFCKAGGAASYLRQRGKVNRVELSALPAGILRNIHPSKYSATLECDDILVMVSDGVFPEQEDWLYGELSQWSGTMQELAEHIVSLSVRYRQVNEREDDLTVICARLIGE